MTTLRPYSKVRIGRFLGVMTVKEREKNWLLIWRKEDLWSCEGKEKARTNSGAPDTLFFSDR